MNKERIHEKATRLLEGGVVEVGNHSVKLGKCPTDAEPCLVCEMDSICHLGTETVEVCFECDIISRDNCYLILTHSG